MSSHHWPRLLATCWVSTPCVVRNKSTSCSTAQSWAFLVPEWTVQVLTWSSRTSRKANLFWFFVYVYNGFCLRTTQKWINLEISSLRPPVVKTKEKRGGGNKSNRRKSLTEWACRRERYSVEQLPSRPKDITRHQKVFSVVIFPGCAWGGPAAMDRVCDASGITSWVSLWRNPFYYKR